MRDNRITNILLIALLVFNLAFIGTWWFSHEKGHKRMHENHEHFAPHDGGKGTMFMLKQLGFDSVQQAKLEIIRKAHCTKVEKMESAISRNEKGVMNALMANPVDSTRANMYADSVGIMKTMMNKDFFKYFRDIKEICTPEQNIKFDTLIEEMSKQFPHHHDMHHQDGGMRQDSVQAP